MKKVVIARKEYKCAHCGKPILIGEKYTLGKGRDPKLDDDDNQIGIEYYQYRLCLEYCGDN